MSKWFYTLIRFMGKVVASIVILIAIISGVVSYLEISDDSSSITGDPVVKFSNFEEFKNSKQKSLSKKELRALKDKFQEDFFKNFELISKNISIYAEATNQPIPNKEALEERLFMIVGRYNYDTRLSYLNQLVKETSNLVNYSEIVATDKTKSNIQWADFLDWFTSDFQYQLNNTNAQKYITIEASKFEKAIIGGIILILIMLGLMMLLLLRRDTKINSMPIEEKPTEETVVQETSETSTEIVSDKEESPTKSEEVLEVEDIPEIEEEKKK